MHSQNHNIHTHNNCIRIIAYLPKDTPQIESYIMFRYPLVHALNDDLFECL